MGVFVESVSIQQLNGDTGIQFIKKNSDKISVVKPFSLIWRVKKYIWNAIYIICIFALHYFSMLYVLCNNLLFINYHIFIFTSYIWQLYIIHKNMALSLFIYIGKESKMYKCINDMSTFADFFQIWRNRSYDVIHLVNEKMFLEYRLREKKSFGYNILVNYLRRIKTVI